MLVFRNWVSFALFADNLRKYGQNVSRIGPTIEKWSLWHRARFAQHEIAHA